MPNTLTVGLVQQQWYPNQDEHQQKLEQGIAEAARKGAKLIVLQELSLSPYFCANQKISAKAFIEDLKTGPSVQFATKMAIQYHVAIVISLVEKGEKDNCYNTAVTVDATGTIVGQTRKQHIPSGEGYHETDSFTPGDAIYPVHQIEGRKIATPTCYDQWFPSLACLYGKKDVDIIAYPTAIGAEPTAPGFDSKEMWQIMQRSHAIFNNCFVVAVNRIGTESMGQDERGQDIGLTMYGSSFICDPTGKLLAEAPRDKPAVLVATLDFDLRDTCKRLFPLRSQMRPEDYANLVTGKNPPLLPNLYGNPTRTT